MVRFTFFFFKQLLVSKAPAIAEICLFRNKYITKAYFIYSVIFIQAYDNEKESSAANNTAIYNHSTLFTDRYVKLNLMKGDDFIGLEAVS